MPSPATALALLAALAPAARVQDPAPTRQDFPASSALAEGVSPEALEALSGLVQSFVDEGEIVGAELLVLENGRSILHQAYGWRDREGEVPMQTGSVFCVRSMTKPVIGAAILMLIQDKVLDFDDRVARFLPAFDAEGSREITVEELLTHTSGLPMSLILDKDLAELDGIGAVAALGGGHALDFAPGSAFQYSDQGTDTLTALIEVVSGMSAADFVRTRVLEPLGMHDSACVLDEDDPLRLRTCSLYVGSRGAWSRYWSPAEPPLFPFFLGSQGLYSTLEDYARFMELWRRRGRVGGERLLAVRSVRKALEPGPQPMSAPTGFPGLRVDYGALMQLWTGPAAEQEDGAEDGERELVVFGHTGSDGTHAWVFPEENAVVLYFTQSRGTLTGLRVEEALGRLFLGAPFDPNEAAPPFADYLGYYFEGEDDLYRAIVLDGEDLALEIMGTGVFAMTYVGEDRWKLRVDPSVVLAFDRAPTGEVTGYHIGDHEEFRFEPALDLPGVDELGRRVAQAYRLDLLETLGPLRIVSELSFEKLGLTGDASTLLVWPNRFRVDLTLENGESERVAYDGERVTYESKAHPKGPLDGSRAESARLGNPFALWGDWHRWHPKLEVIQRMDWGGGIVVVRTGDTSAPARTLYVHEESGRIAREDSLTTIETMGRIGQRISFGDFREVSGILVPYRTETEFAARPLVGTIVTTVTDVELGIEVPEGAFELAD